jgi:hypothetical protein
MQIINALRLAKPYPYYPIFSIIFKDMQIGLFISNMMRWEGKGDDKEGYIWKEYGELYAETGLNDKKVRRIADLMVKMGILSVIRKKPARASSEASVMHYKIYWDKLNQVIESHEIVSNYQNHANNFLIRKQTSNLDSGLIMSQKPKLEVRGGQTSNLEVSTIYTIITIKDRDFFSSLSRKEKTIPPFQSEEFQEALINYLSNIAAKKYKVDERFITKRFNILRKYKEEFAIILLDEASEKPWRNIEFESTAEKYTKWLLENGKVLDKNRVLKNKVATHKVNIENALKEENVNIAILNTIKDDLVLDYNEAVKIGDSDLKNDIMKIGMELTKKINGE